MVPCFAGPLHFRYKLMDTALFFSNNALQKAVTFLFLCHNRLSEEVVQDWLCMQQRVSFFKRTTGISETLEDMHIKQMGMCWQMTQLQ